MSAIYKAACSFALVIALGVSILVWQSLRLQEQKRATESYSNKQKTSSLTGTVSGIENRKMRPLRKPTAVERVNGKLFESMEPSKVVGLIHSGDELARINIATNLNESERAAFAQAFAEYDLQRAKAYLDTGLTNEERTAVLAEISEKKKTWIHGRLGADRSAALIRAETEFNQARAENNARIALTRLSLAVDLKESQANRLYPEFLKREMEQQATPHAETAPFALQPFGVISYDPAIPDISADAEKILTPAQWSAYREVQKSKAQEADIQRELLTKEIVPNLLTAVGEALAEE